MNLKRILALCLVLLTCMSTPAFAAQSRTITVDPIDVIVGGTVFLPTDVNGNNVPVFVYNGTTYAPLRALAEAYGLGVSYNSERKLACITGTASGNFVGTKGTTQALTKRTTLSVSSINIEVNGEVFQPKDINGNPVEIFLYNGTTYAPMRAVAEAYGLTVSYDGEKRLATIDFIEKNNTDYTKMTAEISASHKELVSSTTSFQGIDRYIVSDPSTANLLSEAEVQNLITPRQPKDTLTYTEAATDVDMFFRAFRSAYGGYYYFGEAAWQKAENEIMAWLKGRTTVSRAEFETALADAMDFLQDAHVGIGSVDRGLDLEYEYYYCADQNYCADDTGFYKTASGTKWYFSAFSDPRVSMERTLTADGEIVYSPVLLCPVPDVTDCTVTLKNDAGATKTEQISWIRNESYWGTYYGDVGYNFVKEDGVAYISLRSCDNYYSETLFEYAASGSDTRDASLIIFDIRGNGGGSELYSMDWVTNFIGYSPALPLAGGTRYSVLRTATGFDDGQIAPGTFENYRISGRWIENNIPIIVLVDEYVASAGESTLNYLRAMDNVTVVGSNTTGAQLCGNVMDLFLPNSGTHFRFGSGIGFQYDTSNKDFRGYEPDIWCNPKDSLDAVMKMVERYDIAADVTNMDNALDHVITSKANIVLYLVMDLNTGEFAPLDDPSLKPGERCGMPTIDASQCWMVYKDGVPRSDYTAWSANSDICKITPIDGWCSDTVFEARVVSLGTCKFYVTVDGETAEFIFFAG